MNRTLLKMLPVVAFTVIAAGCASNSELAAVKASAEQAQKTADEAKTAAANAQKTADEAKAAAASAQSAANQALQTANDANSKVDRSFKKSMHK